MKSLVQFQPAPDKVPGQRKARWRFTLVLLVPAFAWMGCVEGSRVERSPYLERAGKAYERHEDLEFRSKNPEYWNSTDWTLHTDMQGGGG